VTGPSLHLPFYFESTTNVFFRFLWRAVFRVDVSVQRRMLVSRKCLGLLAPGLSWEGHAGSGLVEGIGAGFSRDGRGWEDVGFHTESDILPFDGEVGGTPLRHSMERRQRIIRFRVSVPTTVVSMTRQTESRCLLRPRISRGGRLVVDRIPRTERRLRPRPRRGCCYTVGAPQARTRRRRIPRMGYCCRRTGLMRLEPTLRSPQASVLPCQQQRSSALPANAPRASLLPMLEIPRTRMFCTRMPSLPTASVFLHPPLRIPTTIWQQLVALPA